MDKKKKFNPAENLAVNPAVNAAENPVESLVEQFVENHAEKLVVKEIKSLDFDKAEYQEIILSNSNHPDKFFYDKYL